jgi:hypothetical protein
MAAHTCRFASATGGGRSDRHLGLWPSMGVGSPNNPDDRRRSRTGRHRREVLGGDGELTVRRQVDPISGWAVEARPKSALRWMPISAGDPRTDSRRRAGRMAWSTEWWRATAAERCSSGDGLRRPRRQRRRREGADRTSTGSDASLRRRPPSCCPRSCVTSCIPAEPAGQALPDRSSRALCWERAHHPTRSSACLAIRRLAWMARNSRTTIGHASKDRPGRPSVLRWR